MVWFWVLQLKDVLRGSEIDRLYELYRQKEKFKRDKNATKNDFCRKVYEAQIFHHERDIKSILYEADDICCYEFKTRLDDACFKYFLD